MAEPASLIRIEVVQAGPSSAWRVELALPAGSTVSVALQYIGQIEGAPGDADVTALGIFGRRVDVGQVLGDGDRLELYRVLRIDPKEARRKRANRTSR